MRNRGEHFSFKVLLPNQNAIELSKEKGRLIVDEYSPGHAPRGLKLCQRQLHPHLIRASIQSRFIFPNRMGSPWPKRISIAIK
jgi:hypothetical protein